MSCKGISETSRLWRNLFEGYSHNLIRRGEHFCIKSLNTSLTADGIVSISETEFESFGKVYESSMTVSTEYFQSKSKILCAIDLLISEPTFPNDCQSESWNQTPWLGKHCQSFIVYVRKKKLRLYFVVPEDIYVIS
nr:11378_t:CDS:2 [Entrophospora candida]